MSVDDTPCRVGVVLFEGFELLDVFGPLEMFGLCGSNFEILLIAPRIGPVASAQGPRVVADVGYLEAPTCSIVMLPGGIGTRRLVQDPGFLEWLSNWSEGAEYVTSVCTGSAVLAAAGLLDGYRATSNKIALEWASQQGEQVIWERRARWVHDRDRWTSSGVSAGIDMALAIIEHLCGPELAEQVAKFAEYEWHRDPNWDPFATAGDLSAD